MQLLVLGATGLSGTAITHEALARGHRVVAVHRGRSDTLPADPATDADDQLIDLEHDRVNGHAELLACGPYDAIIDVSARVPAWVADAVRVLDAGVPWWLQLSSVSAYADLSSAGRAEPDAVATFDDPARELSAVMDPTLELTAAEYGASKAACERLLLEAQARQPRSTVLRPVLITGAHDATWRVPWWVQRIAAGGIVPAPPAEDPIQVLDARDLARLALDAVEQRIAGVYNAAPAPGTQTIGGLLAACRQAARAAGIEPAEVRHLPRERFEQHAVAPWSQLPAWVPPDGDHAGIAAVSTELVAEVLGFEARPLTETAAWVLDWIRSGGSPGPGITAGLTPELEQALLEDR